MYSQPCAPCLGFQRPESPRMRMCNTSAFSIRREGLIKCCNPTQTSGVPAQLPGKWRGPSRAAHYKGENRRMPACKAPAVTTAAR